MTDTTQWAQDRAREWFKRWQQDLSGYSYALSHNDWLEISGDEVASLAALLVEVEDRCVEAFTSEEPCPKCGLGVSARCYGCQIVEQRKTLLAEVRRVVEEECDEVATEMGPARYAAATALRKALLSRLDALDPLRAEDLLDGLPRTGGEK